MKSKVRLSLFFMLFFVMGVSAESFSQREKVTLDMKAGSVRELCDAIRKQTGLQFIYGENEVSGLKINLQAREKTVEEVLQEVFSGTSLTFSCEEDVIFIVRREEQAPQQQQVLLKGKVMEADGQPLPGATVQVKGSLIGTSADVDGNFSLNIPRSLIEQGELKLLFTFIGKISQEVVYSGQENITVRLADDEQALENVVVRGVFNRPAENYTGSVVIIGKEEIKRSGSRDIVRTLGNIDASFNVLESNEWGSDPNRLPELTVRGNSVLPPKAEDLVSDVSQQLNTPLILLNGFPISLRQFMDIDVDEIENIQLLKDAVATAQFGSRGANGVVMVTTILPQPGQLRFSYNGSLALEIPDLSSYDLLNAREKLDLEYKAGYFSHERAEADFDLKRLYLSRLADVERGVDTDWLSQPVRVGVGHYHRGALTGGDEKFRYQMYVSNRHVAGAMKGVKRNTTNAGITLTYTTGSLQFQNMASLTIATAGLSSGYGSFSQYARMNPYYRIHDEDGKLIKEYSTSMAYYYDYGRSVANPMYNTRLHVVDESQTKTLFNNFSVDWNPLEGLTLTGTFSISSVDGTSDYFLPADHTRFIEEPDPALKGEYTYGVNHSNALEASIRAQYATVLNDLHLLSFGANGEISDSKSHQYSFTARGFQHEKLDFLPNALKYDDNKDSPSGSESHTRRVSASAFGSYTYDRRYTADINYRLDGSSQYGNDNRWQHFFSVGANWNMHNESFFKDFDLINSLKLRATYGINGSNTLEAYGAVRTFEYYSGSFYNNWVGSHLMSLVNNDLGWSFTKKQNYGFDLYMLNNWINLVADYYIHVTDDQISSISLPSSNGFSFYSANVMSTKNWGLELKGYFKIIDNHSRRTFLSVGFSAAHEKDRVQKVSAEMKAEVERNRADKKTTPYTFIEEGKSRNMLFVVPSLGIDPSTGKELYLKKNGEVTYIYDPADVVGVGSKTPKVRGNANFTLRYRDLTFTGTFKYEWGAKAYNTTLINRVENANKYYNVDRRVYEDRWSTPGQRAFYKGINETGTTYASSRFVQKKNEIQCSSLDIRYDLLEGVKALQNIGLSSLSINASWNDVFRLSTIKQERGTESPFAHNITFGISAAF